jgi:hypothetical protein
MIAAPATLIVLMLAASPAPVDASAVAAPLQPGRPTLCSEWHECRQQALDAAARGDYETFHDLAWRAVQTGPPKNPELMYLLARAQALSGRPHDALVMLERLADMGVPSDAATSDDFRRTRELPGWPDLLARIDGSPRPASSSPAAVTAPSATATPPATAAANATPSRALPPKAAPAVALPPTPAPAAPSAAASAIAPVAAPEALRFSSGRFTAGGLAYDAVSRRFLVGDRLGRKLIVVGDGSNRAVAFVRADSAGFHDISAIEIDAKRGDLWVASAAPAEGSGTLHKLQLISGRPLRSFAAAADLEPVTPVDLAVTSAGAVLVLDSAGRQLLVLHPGGTALERVARIDAEDLASVAAGDDEGVAYVAHRDGVSRIDLRARTVSPVSAPAAISLRRLERIRWYKRALIAIRLDDDGTRHLVRLELNATGRAVTKAATLEGIVPPAGETFVAINGDELVYLVDGSRGVTGAGDPPPDPVPGTTEFVAYRVRLR